jgi:hypothetical protein
MFRYFLPINKRVMCTKRNLCETSQGQLVSAIRLDKRMCGLGLEINLRNKSRVSHISLVSCEMWDTTAFDLQPLEPNRHITLRFVSHSLFAKPGSEKSGKRYKLATLIGRPGR